MVQHRFIYNLNNIRELFSLSPSLISEDCQTFLSTNKQSFKIEYQKMTFFPGTPLHFSPNRKLGSYSKESSHSEQIIQKLSRQNAYLKTQLFSLIQNTPLFDAVNTNQTCIYETKVNTARIFLSPTPQVLCSPQNNRGTIQFLKGGTVGKKFFSPSSSPNSRKTQQFFRMKSRSPRNTLDYYKQSMGQQKAKEKQIIVKQGNFNELKTNRSYNASPNKVTPQQSCIFSPGMNVQKSRSPTLNFRKLKQQEVILSKVKRYKSPSFLKNRKSLKENIQKCMQNIANNTYNQHQLIRQVQERETYEKSELSSKEDDLNDMYEQLQKYQAKIEADNKENDRKKQGYFNYSEAGSTISIERRLKEIMNYPNPA